MSSLLLYFFLIEASNSILKMLSKYFLNYIKKRATSVPAVSLRSFSFLYKIEYIYLLVNKQIVLHVHVVMVICFT